MHTHHHWTAPDGTALLMRPLSLRDAPALDALFNSLPDRDRRSRFHGAVKGLSPSWLQRLTRVDPRHLALGVTVQGAGGDALIAEARWAIDDSGNAAELAMLVAPAWRRHGIGQRCVRALLQSAAESGLRWLYGRVLIDNAAMLVLLQRAGFRCRVSRSEQELVIAERALEAGDPASAGLWPARRSPGLGLQL